MNDIIKAAIEFAHKLHRDGYCWDECVGLASEAFGVTGDDIDYIFDSYDA